MADGCELRVHPTGKAQLRPQRADPGPGPRDDLRPDRRRRSSGIPPEDVEVIHGDTDNTPFGLGTYGSRSTPVSGAAAAVVARRIKDKARIIAAAALECSPDDLEWEHGRWFVKGDPEQGKTIQEIAFLAHGTPGAARGRRGPPRRLGGVRPAQPHVPVRRLPLRGRRGPRHRPGEGAPVHRRRRLRAAHQPDDRRGPDPRWSGRRDRHGPDAGDRLRRGRQLPRRVVHGLPAADVDGVPDAGSSARP